jgi:glycosyltransferase involved in cell wall biosynthesis
MSGALSVSVVIPTRDRPDWVRRSVSSALAQEDLELEIVVVDDGSTTPIDLPDDERLRIVRHERPLGVARARNAGLASAGTEWVAFLDDDDWWAPGKLARQLAAAHGAQADFAWCGGFTVDPAGKVLNLDPTWRPEPDLHAALLRMNMIPCGCSNVVARTDLVRRVGGFDPQFSVLADWDLNVRLSAAARGALTTELLIAYTLHADNMHYSDTPAEEDKRRFDAKYRAARAGKGVETDDEWWLSWRFRAQLMTGRDRAAARSAWRLYRANHEAAILGRAIVLAVAGRQGLDRAGAISRRVRGRPGGATEVREAVPAAPPLS